MLCINYVHVYVQAGTNGITGDCGEEGILLQKADADKMKISDYQPFAGDNQIEKSTSFDLTAVRVTH
jgi:hypothetical protein